MGIKIVFRHKIDKMEVFLIALWHVTINKTNLQSAVLRLHITKRKEKGDEEKRM